MDYQKLSREELIQLVLQLHARIRELEERFTASKKDSTNSSKPPSSDFPKKDRSLREKSGRKSGGQIGHIGKTRPLVENPDVMVDCKPDTCQGCGNDISGEIGMVIGREQIIDIPPITPVITQYNQIEIQCVCGTKTAGTLPNGAAGVIRIGENIRSFVSYLNVTHHMPYDRLTIMFADLLNVTISEGSIATMLAVAGEKGRIIYQKIKAMVSSSSYRGSDETGVRVMGKTWWEWVWQNEKASYYVIDPSRGYGVVTREMPEVYPWVHVADCWCAQNNTRAAYHQLCHEHLKRDLDFLVESQKSIWAYQMYHFLFKSKKARDQLWQLPQMLRTFVIASYHIKLNQLLGQVVSTKKEQTLQKRFLKHRDKILTFMDFVNVPCDNNGSERAIRMSKIKMKVSGGFRSEQGAKTYATLLSIIETCKKQHLNILSTLQDMLRGVDISTQFTT